MPDDLPQDRVTTDRTSQYYLNKRIDSLEENMQIGFEHIMDAIRDNKTQIHEVLLECQKGCYSEIKSLRTEVSSLQEFKNRAIGAKAIVIISASTILAILSIWKLLGGN